MVCTASRIASSIAGKITVAVPEDLDVVPLRGRDADDALERPPQRGDAFAGDVAFGRSSRRERRHAGVARPVRSPVSSGSGLDHLALAPWRRGAGPNGLELRRERRPEQQREDQKNAQNASATIGERPVGRPERRAQPEERVERQRHQREERDQDRRSERQPRPPGLVTTRRPPEDERDRGDEEGDRERPPRDVPSRGRCCRRVRTRWPCRGPTRRRRAWPSPASSSSTNACPYLWSVSRSFSTPYRRLRSARSADQRRAGDERADRTDRDADPLPVGTGAVRLVDGGRQDATRRSGRRPAGGRRRSSGWAPDGARDPHGRDDVDEDQRQQEGRSCVAEAVRVAQPRDRVLHAVASGRFEQGSPWRHHRSAPSRARHPRCSWLLLSLWHAHRDGGGLHAELQSLRLGCGRRLSS